jgi:predicted CoA-binding protein
MSQTVAVIGASRNHDKFGNKAVRAFAARGYTVIPIHPREHEVEGLRAYPSVLDVPGTIDLATLYVPPYIGVRILDEIVKKGIAEVWLNPGADGPAVVAHARELGLRAIQLCSILTIGENPSRL